MARKSFDKLFKNQTALKVMVFKHKTNEITIDIKSLTMLLFLTQLMLLSFPTQKNFNGPKDFICDVILQNEEREICAYKSFQTQLFLDFRNVMCPFKTLKKVFLNNYNL